MTKQQKIKPNPIFIFKKLKQENQPKITSLFY